MNLGNAYAELPVGDRAANLQKAIACYEEALRFRTPEAAPLDYASTQLNLGEAYRQLPVGDRAANLRKAMVYFDQALLVFTPEAAPFDYARTQTNLGQAYAELPVGDRATNLQKAIACYEQALRFHTPEAASLDYARIQTSLGNAYDRMPVGDRQANLQKAIACFEQALRFHTPEATPLDYASTQMNLGNAYSVLPVGDRAANLQKAIACYEQALRFDTPEAAPLGYAVTQTNLGTAYAELPVGDRADNLQRAIDSFEQALRFRTPEAAPLDYAGTQTNLGVAYSRLPVGDRADNLQKAIACYEQALRFYTLEATPFDYARTQNNLGTAYSVLPVGDRADNLRQAIACYEQALRFRTAEAAPLDYAMTQTNLGEAYRQLPVGERAANLRQAIACYEQALRVCTPESVPDRCRTAANQLGSLYFAERQWGQAYNVYSTAIAATEALYQVASTETSRQAELEAGPDLFPNLAFCLARLDMSNEAVEQLEAGKARGLAEALARDRAALDGVKGEDQVAFEAARSRIKSLQVEARSIGSKAGSEYTTSRSFIEISEDLRVARHDLDSVIDRIRAYQPEFMSPGLNFETIAATVMPECPLVYLITTSQGSLALIVPPGAKAIDTDHVVWLEEFRSGDLDGLLVQRNAAGKAIGGYLVGQVLGGQQQLQAGLNRALPILRDRLVGPLAARLRELGFQRASLVPGGRLSLLPLHAASFDAVTFTYAPSARALRAARGAARERAERAPMLLGIGNPLPSPQPLAFARTEVEEIAPRFAPEARHVLFEREATRAATAQALSGATHLHLACHGRFDPNEPLDSALYLSGDDREFDLRLMSAVNDANEIPTKGKNLVILARVGMHNVLHFRIFETDCKRVVDTNEKSLQNQARQVEELKNQLNNLWTVPKLSKSDKDRVISSVTSIVDHTNDRLTLRDLLDGGLDVSAARLAVLSACQTGIVDFHKVPDEAIGFPAGFIQAGVPGVVSTLWPVNDISTALLMSRFYVEYLGNGLDPASALHRAQDWLRTTTARDMSLADRYKRRYLESGRTDPDAFNAWRQFRANPEARPFAHPYYWAAFTFTGVA